MLKKVCIYFYFINIFTKNEVLNFIVSFLPSVLPTVFQPRQERWPAGEWEAEVGAVTARSWPSLWGQGERNRHGAAPSSGGCIRRAVPPSHLPRQLSQQRMQPSHGAP